MNLEYKILIVDDVVENIQVAMNILKEENYKLLFAQNGKSALELMRDNSFDIVLLDIMMPGMDGYEVCIQMKKEKALADIPVIFLTAKTDTDSMAKAFDVGGVDYIIKPFHAKELLSRTKTHLELFKAKQILKENNLSLVVKMEKQEKRIYTELEENQKEMIFVLTEMIESVSDETGRHIKRVSEYSRLLAQYHPAINEEDVSLIYYATPMHDIGKMGIPNEILHKKGKLTEEEFEIMKTHTTKAHSYLKIPNRKIMQAADVIAYQHHEKWNGKGYPQGLKGESIHLYARIVAIADVFDALTHKRAYKDAWKISDAVDYIIAHSGTQFDPELVELFATHKEEFISIAKN